MNAPNNRQDMQIIIESKLEQNGKAARIAGAGRRRYLREAAQGGGRRAGGAGALGFRSGREISGGGVPGTEKIGRRFICERNTGWLAPNEHRGDQLLERTGGRGSRTIGIGRRTVSLNSVERTNIFLQYFFLLCFMETDDACVRRVEDQTDSLLDRQGLCFSSLTK
jgi:hypothetical protein